MSMASVLRHIGSVHSFEPNFHVSCGINDCPRTYENYHSFRKHLNRHHPECLKPSSSSTGSSEDINHLIHVDGEQPEDETITEIEQSATNRKSEHHNALFIVKLEEIFKIPQTLSLDDIAGIVSRSISNRTFLMLCIEIILTLKVLMVCPMSSQIQSTQSFF